MADESKIPTSEKLIGDIVLVLSLYARTINLENLVFHEKMLSIFAVFPVEFCFRPYIFLFFSTVEKKIKIENELDFMEKVLANFILVSVSRNIWSKKTRESYISLIIIDRILRRSILRTT